MSSHRRRYSKRELLGSLHVDYVMSISDLGLVRINRWEVLRAFLNRGEGRAECLVEAQDGFLILIEAFLGDKTLVRSTSTGKVLVRFSG